MAVSGKPIVSDASQDEALIVSRQGLAFINIPIMHDPPAEQDYEQFDLTLNAFSKRKVLVYCQFNRRASSMVFLYRVIVGNEDPRLAYESVTSVWAPDGPWRGFMHELLFKHGLNFEPY